MLPVVIGCRPFIDPNVPEPIRPFVEPSRGGEYLLYRPSSYDGGRSWPLIVVCHGGLGDSANKQIRDWTQLAEEKGFIILAPELESTGGLILPAAEKQIEKQRADEQRILRAIRHVQAGHNVSEDRTFIHGFAGGSYAAMYAGLGNPTVFRAVSLTRPSFKAGFMGEVADRIDVHQPVFVDYDLGDTIFGNHAQRCLEWLRSKQANVTEDATGMLKRTDARKAVTFFERVLRDQPWLHIRAFATPGGERLDVQFKLRVSFSPVRYQWSFGDSEESSAAEPLHRYQGEGTYRVTITVEDPNGESHTRSARVVVPAGRIVR